MISDLSGRIDKANQTSQQIYQSFYDVGMIENMPSSGKAPNVTEYNQQAFSDIESALILLKNTVNNLVDLFNSYKFVDIAGNKVIGVEYWGSDVSGLDDAYNSFNQTLNKIENALESMIEIMVLNGLIERI